MADRSAIEWTDASWNPIRARNKATGKVGWHCEHATTGCINCYAEGFNKRLGTGLDFKPGHLDSGEIELFLDEDILKQPLHWKRPRKVFVGSMTDLFGRFVPDEWLFEIFAVMGACEDRPLGHEFQVLTKRADRMRQWISEHGYRAWNSARLSSNAWPARNVWLGVSTERQQEADDRIPHLLRTPSAVRFISAEPLLDRIDLVSPLYTGEAGITMRGYLRDHAEPDDFHHHASKLDWIIAGGESGPKARLTSAYWVRLLRDQCSAARTPFFLKQWGEYLPVGQHLPDYGKVHGATAVKPGRMKLHYGGSRTQAPAHAYAERGVDFASTDDGLLTFRVGKKAAGRLLDGVEHNGFPKVPA
jgi:protein gp37